MYSSLMPPVLNNTLGYNGHSHMSASTTDAEAFQFI